jgi:hypothetical protein
MNESPDSRMNFLGTYFDAQVVLKISLLANVISWVILVIYALGWLIQIGVQILQYSRGFLIGMGLTDYLQSLFFLLREPLAGVIFFVILQAVSKGLLILLDMEENMRRATRSLQNKK